MWVDYRGSLSTVYNDGEISTCGYIIEVHPIQSTMIVPYFGKINNLMYNNMLSNKMKTQLNFIIKRTRIGTYSEQG